MQEIQVNTNISTSIWYHDFGFILSILKTALSRFDEDTIL